MAVAASAASGAATSLAKAVGELAVEDAADDDEALPEEPEMETEPEPADSADCCCCFMRSIALM